ncbi:MAG: hypothetical protein GY814_15680 [Gammaproteobacteria bacterium]|nr:hypothetical protein [Gammaproteobacteria bacterium]
MSSIWAWSGDGCATLPGANVYSIGSKFSHSGDFREQMQRLDEVMVSQHILCHLT